MYRKKCVLLQLLLVTIALLPPTDFSRQNMFAFFPCRDVRTRVFTQSNFSFDGRSLTLLVQIQHGQNHQLPQVAGILLLPILPVPIV